MNTVTEIETSHKEKATEKWVTHIATFFLFWEQNPNGPELLLLLDFFMITS